MHINAVQQNLYVCARRNLGALLTFTENFAPLISIHIFTRLIYNLLKLECQQCKKTRVRKYIQIKVKQHLIADN